jgi:hypothetical protein
MGHDAGVDKTHLPIHRTDNRVGSPTGGWSDSGSSTLLIAISSHPP